jgi:pilus assembly protein Flp/PilA
MDRLRRVTAAAKDRGASAVEYALLVGAIAAVIVVVVFGLGSVVKNNFVDTCAKIEAKNNATVPDSQAC